MTGQRQTKHLWHQLGAMMVAFAIVTGVTATTSFLGMVAVEADTLNYPDYNQPCEHSPYTTSGGANYCSNLDWGPIPDTTPGWTESASYSSRGYGYRNCTDYVAWKEGTVGVSVPHTLGDGGQWYNNAPASQRSTTPKPWDAAVVPPTTTSPHGHVAFVESVNMDGTITVSEYNRLLDGAGDTRIGMPGAMGFTEFVDFGVHPPGGDSGSSGGAPTTSRPAVVTRDPDHMDVFYLDTNHELVNIGWNSTSGWGIPGVIATYAYSNPAVTSRGSDSMDIFYRDGNSNLMNVGWTAANGWSGPWPRVSNGTVNGDPTVIHRTSDSMDVFYHDSHDNLVNEGWTVSNGWSGPWTLVGNSSLAGSPVAITRFTGQMSVFYRDKSNDLMEEAWDSRGWNGPWPHVTGSAAGDFSAITRTQDSVDVVYQTTGGGVAKAGWTANGWNQQTFVGSGTIGNPTILSRDPGNMEVFWRDAQGNLVNDGFGTNGWSGPFIRSNNVGDNPVGVSRAQSNMDLFFRMSSIR